MPGHVFSQIYLHLNWHTYRDLPLINQKIEGVVWDEIRYQSSKIEGLTGLEIGGTENHIHFLVRTEPFIQLSEAIRKIKGGSAAQLNKRYGAETIKWQRGYGVVSFSKHHLKVVSKYVRNQKMHHHMMTTEAVLEQIRSDLKIHE